MSRSFGFDNLVTLPRLSAAEAVVLMTELDTAAKAWVAQEKKRLESEKKKKPKDEDLLPQAIARSLARLLAQRSALALITAPSTQEADTQVKRKADRALDNAWGATFDWLIGWTRLPEPWNPDQAAALTLHRLVFPQMLGFLKLAYKIQWRESQARLDAIARENQEETFKRLGGLKFLAAIRDTHAEYGRVLHITAARPDEPPEADVRAALLAALGAMREYVARVAAHADPDDPGSEALTQALLRPVVAWESRSGRGGGAESEGPDGATSEDGAEGEGNGPKERPV
ncbi:MAG TPA: hypothetical protein VLS89_06925 [Candidatus Nanopelagicales bacterium]|nr:hypothetical protein [Candidatus Nanopelagicales bacterium]